MKSLLIAALGADAVLVESRGSTSEAAAVFTNASITPIGSGAMVTGSTIIARHQYRPSYGVGYQVDVALDHPIMIFGMLAVSHLDSYFIAAISGLYWHRSGSIWNLVLDWRRRVQIIIRWESLQI